VIQSPLQAKFKQHLSKVTGKSHPPLLTESQLLSVQFQTLLLHYRSPQQREKTASVKCEKPTLTEPSCQRSEHGTGLSSTRRWC